jgi:hypothetical protein
MKERIKKINKYLFKIGYTEDAIINFWNDCINDFKTKVKWIRK